MKELVSVIVPVLHTEPHGMESQVLDHTYRMLEAYPIILLVAESADQGGLKERYSKADIITFPDKHFASELSLRRLYLMEGFYERFSWCDFLLILGLNTWVVKDELYYWCKQGYDYFRAEPVGNIPGTFEKVKGLGPAALQDFDEAYTGNAVFLCRIERMMKTLRSKKKAAHAYRHRDDLQNPDALFWELEAGGVFSSLRTPTPIVMQRFARTVSRVEALQPDNREDWPFAVTGLPGGQQTNLPVFING